MRIGLLGFCFQDENKGCEALTYSFINMLRENLDDLEICNLSENRLGEIPINFPSIKFFHHRLRIKKPIDTINFLNELDWVYDITYGDGFSDIYNSRFVLMTTLQKLFVVKSKTPLVLLPQTYGPFKNRLLERFASYVIKKSQVVYVRDRLSKEYVKKISGVKAVETTDLAFALPYERIDFETTKIKVGINVSGLLWNGGFDGNKNQFGLTVSYRDYIEELLKYLLSDDKYEVYIIPHVLELYESSHDGDIEVCKHIKEKYSIRYMCENKTSSIDIKSYIAGMDIFIGARMHSTIAAFSSGVATIPFSYSRKFEGLYGDLDYPFLIYGKSDTTEEAIKKTIKYIKEYDKLLEASKVSMQYVKEMLKKIQILHVK